MLFDCCKYCEKRFPGYHDNCEDYKSDKLKITELNEKKRHEKSIESIIVGHIINTKRRE